MDGEIKYIRVEESEDEVNEKDVKAFEELYDKYIKEYGLSKIYIRYLNQMKKLALSQLAYVEDSVKNKRALNDIEYNEIELAKIKSMMKGDGTTIEDTLIYLSKFIGYNIDSRQITATRYYTMLKAYERANKKK